MRVRDSSGDRHCVAAGHAGRVSASTYDLLLAAVPTLLLAGAAAATQVALPVWAGLGLSSLLAALLVAYGLFVEPPIDPCDA